MHSKRTRRKKKYNIALHRKFLICIVTFLIYILKQIKQANNAFVTNFHLQIPPSPPKIHVFITGDIFLWFPDYEDLIIVAYRSNQRSFQWNTLYISCIY